MRGEKLHYDDVAKGNRCGRRSAGCLKAMRIEVAVTADVAVRSDCMGDPDAPPVNTTGFCAP